MANLSITAEEIDARLNTVINTVTSNLNITSANVETYRFSTIFFSNTSDSTITIDDDVFTAGDKLHIKFYNATDNGQKLTITQSGTGGAFDGNSSAIVYNNGSIFLGYSGSNVWGVCAKNRTKAIEKVEQLSAEALGAPGENAASLVAHGFTTAREFTYNKDNFISANIAIRADMDRTIEPVIRIGWSSPSITGNIVWSLEYKYVALGEDTTSITPDETIKVVETVSGTANSYDFTQFTLDLPSSTDRGIGIRITRPGATDSDDTCGGTVNAFALNFAYTPKY